MVVRLPEEVAGRVVVPDGVTTVRVTVLDDWPVVGEAGLVVVGVVVVAGRVTVVGAVVVVAGRVTVVVDDAGAVLGAVGVDGVEAGVPGVVVVDVPGRAVLVLSVGCAVTSLRVGWPLPVAGLAVPVEASIRSGVLVLVLPASTREL